MVIEFAYGIFLATGTLYNWQDSQRLAIAAKSAVPYVTKFIQEHQNEETPVEITREIEIPLKPVHVSGRERYDQIMAHIEDESAKFNINTLVYTNGLPNEGAYLGFVRLLRNLDLDISAADAVIDWIDPDKENRYPHGEKEAKDDFLVKLDELLLIKGIDERIYARLRPFLTIWGDGMVNINTASKEVLMGLHEDITAELADRIISYRSRTPFDNPAQITQVSGMETIGIALQGRISARSDAYFIQVTGKCEGVKRIVETSQVYRGGHFITCYWKEY